MAAELVDSLTEFPGCCQVSGTSEGPFVIDRHRLIRYPDAPLILSVDVLREFAAPAGLVDRTESDAAIAALQAEVDAMRAQLDGMADELQRARALEEAVAHTLREGAVIRRGTISLRSPRGRPAVDLEARGARQG